MHAGGDRLEEADRLLLLACCALDQNNCFLSRFNKHLFQISLVLIFFFLFKQTNVPNRKPYEPLIVFDTFSQTQPLT